MRQYGAKQEELGTMKQALEEMNQKQLKFEEYRKNKAEYQELKGKEKEIVENTLMAAAKKKNQ